MCFTVSSISTKKSILAIFCIQNVHFITNGAQVSLSNAPALVGGEKSKSEVNITNKHEHVSTQTISSFKDGERTVGVVYGTVTFTDLLQVQLQLLLQFKDAALMFALHLKHVLLLQSITQHTYSKLSFNFSCSSRMLRWCLHCISSTCFSCSLQHSTQDDLFSPDGHSKHPYGSYGLLWAVLCPANNIHWKYFNISLIHISCCVFTYLITSSRAWPSDTGLPLTLLKSIWCDMYEVASSNRLNSRSTISSLSFGTWNINHHTALVSITVDE